LLVQDQDEYGAFLTSGFQGVPALVWYPAWYYLPDVGSLPRSCSILLTGLRGRQSPLLSPQQPHSSPLERNIDGFVKSPSAALRFIFRHCSVLSCTPHSSRFARLASGAFYCAVHLRDFLRSHQYPIKCQTNSLPEIGGDQWHRS
jgi:hypothetical protein